MTRHDDAGTRQRQRQLAGVLLAGAGLFDALAGIGDVDDDPYVVVTREGMFHLDVSGWMWAHLVTAVLMLSAGLLLFTGRRWSLRLAAAAAIVGIGVHLMVLPYQPLWALIVIGLAVAALRLLWRCRPGDRRPEVSAGDRSAR
ncbi:MULTISPECIES: hypothetical protein [unclassified Micromonospora]|uniref:DUF7144 family membrane protein n=1 Tax=unclassified Micromonospora TaxID=2617518 RepID=UPI0013D3B2BC|nr:MULTISPECIES: hypothetical protein [unclassified Micromonospora]NES15932.1 hypothetical protein [Micromonospora sp. PPF5-17B]NES57923.1 hypothetical protein [Micromonospora sp. PPF5-6]